MEPEHRAWLLLARCRPPRCAARLPSTWRAGRAGRQPGPPAAAWPGGHRLCRWLAACPRPNATWLWTSGAPPVSQAGRALAHARDALSWPQQGSRCCASSINSSRAFIDTFPATLPAASALLCATAPSCALRPGLEVTHRQLPVPCSCGPTARWEPRGGERTHLCVPSEVVLPLQIHALPCIFPNASGGVGCGEEVGRGRPRGAGGPSAERSVAGPPSTLPRAGGDTEAHTPNIQLGWFLLLCTVCLLPLPDPRASSLPASLDQAGRGFPPAVPIPAYTPLPRSLASCIAVPEPWVH